MTATLSLPTFNRWMLPDDAGDVLRELVEKHRPASILECGSGRSTLHLAAAARDFGSHVISLEHQLEYADATTAMLLDNSLEEHANVRHAPLEGNPLWYAGTGWADLAGVELLFIDGPPGHIAERAREPARDNLHGRLARGCIVVMDDMNRRHEKEIWRNWRHAAGLSEPTFVQHSTGYLATGILP